MKLSIEKIHLLRELHNENDIDRVYDEKDNRFTDNSLENWYSASNLMYVGKVTEEEKVEIQEFLPF